MDENPEGTNAEADEGAVNNGATLMEDDSTPSPEIPHLEQVPKGKKKN